MRNMIANRKVICDVLLEHAAVDRDIIVLCSDSRGSASMTAFAEAYPEQFFDVGIAEQNLVSVSAGLAACGKRPFAFSPASFLSTRSMEQIRIDVAYSNMNVKLIGISGGISYGALGMTHHSNQDIAVMGSIPNMRVYLPSDRFQTKKLMETLINDAMPAYVRVGRNAVEDIYQEEMPFVMNEAVVLKKGTDLTIIACGEMVKIAKNAAEILEKEQISCRVLDMYCIKPLDTISIISAALETKAILTLEEHSHIGGLGSLVCQVVSEHAPCPVHCMALPDQPVIAGKSEEVLAYYGLDAAGVAKAGRKML